MDIRELKKLLRHSALVLIMENGEPSLVVMDYHAYRSINDGVRKDEPEQSDGDQLADTSGEKSQQSSLSTQELEMIDRLNKEIMALKEQIEAEERSELG